MNLFNRRSFVASSSLVIASSFLNEANAKETAQTNTSKKWVGTWASSQMIPNGDGLIPNSHSKNVTIRQVFRISAGGDKFRLKLSNAHGNGPLEFKDVVLSIPKDIITSEIDIQKLVRVRFNNKNKVIIPAGAEYFSDPIDIKLAPLSFVSISMYLPEIGSPQTGHPGSRNTTHFTLDNHSTKQFIPEAKTLDRWFYIAGFDVFAPKNNASIVTLGDSITDGYGVKPGKNGRWTDRFAERLQALPSKSHLSVLNHGIGGGRVLKYGNGPSAVARFERDVLSQTGVKYLVILKGVNDLGNLAKNIDDDTVTLNGFIEEMKDAYTQMTLRAREKGIIVIGATILPYEGAAYYNPKTGEIARQEINKWIRTSSNYDAIIDFDKIMADPQNPKRLNPLYDCGDHLHPSLDGYKHMGNMVNLNLFR